jgi:hypothetical protein
MRFASCLRAIDELLSVFPLEGVSTVVPKRSSLAFVVRGGSLSTRTDSIGEGVTVGGASCLAMLLRWRWSTPREQVVDRTHSSLLGTVLHPWDAACVWHGWGLRVSTAASRAKRCLVKAFGSSLGTSELGGRALRGNATHTAVLGAGAQFSAVVMRSLTGRELIGCF